MPDRELTREGLQQALEGMLFGRNIQYHATIGSTNVEAHRLAREGAPEGTLVIADEQTAGRGRRGRSWLAPGGSSLLVSLLFRPYLPPGRSQYLTMVCALATLDAVTPLVSGRVDLKWPNDLTSGARKLAGILTEIVASGSRLDYVVVGIGLNLNWRPEALPELADIATSMSSLAGRPVPRLPVLVAMLEGVERRYAAVSAGEAPVEEWARRLGTIGQRVTVHTVNGPVSGVAESVDERGALVVRSEDGQAVRLMEGDVILAHGSP